MIFPNWLNIYTDIGEVIYSNNYIELVDITMEPIIVSAEVSYEELEIEVSSSTLSLEVEQENIAMEIL